MSVIRTVLLCSVVQLVGLIIFLVGFFPFGNISRNDNIDLGCIKGNCIQNTTAYFDKLVLIVIDAWRKDFLLKPDENLSSMKFLDHLVSKRNAYVFVGRAQTPTVTLPRIKALLTGTIPVFIDVLRNFAASELQDENLIDGFIKAGKKVVFYGDDTWLRILPGRFVRSEGVSSFFVADYTEVDDNVTRHIDREFVQRKDWDALILHYLGLDHIGHSFGPRNHRISSKLAEMDAVIEKIYRSIEKNQLEKSLLVVVGDHGMSELGSHGGASADEVLMPVALCSPRFAYGKVRSSPIIEQIDLVPTLAFLMGVPVPSSSLGIALTEVFEKQSSLQTLNLLEANVVQIVRAYGDAEDAKRYSLLVEKKHSFLLASANISAEQRSHGLKVLVSNYRQFVGEMRDSSIAHLRSFNSIYLVIGMLLCLSTTFVLFVKFYQAFAARKKMTDCVFTVLVAVSYFSSSFIEEEHQTRYFLWSTELIILAVAEIYLHFSSVIVSCKKRASSNQCKPQSTYYELFWKEQSLVLAVSLCVLHRALRSWNQTGNKFAHLPDVVDWLMNDDVIIVRSLFVVMSLFVIFLCICSNGVHWLPQIAVAVGLCCIYLYHVDMQNVLLPMVSGSLLDNRGTVAARCVYMAAVCVCVYGLFVATSGCNQTRAVILVCVLLSNCASIPVLAGIMLTEELLFRLLENQTITSNNKPPCRLTVAFAYDQLASVSFFYLGNSNSIGTVNVAAGYVGLTSYLPLLNALLILCCLYTGPLIVHMKLADRLQQLNTTKSSFIEVVFPLLLNRSVFLLATLIANFNLRYHLFVWSVFAPKLLYESLHTVYLYIWIMYYCYKFVKNKRAQT